MPANVWAFQNQVEIGWLMTCLVGYKATMRGPSPSQIPIISAWENCFRSHDLLSKVASRSYFTVINLPPIAMLLWSYKFLQSTLPAQWVFKGDTTRKAPRITQHTSVTVTSVC